MAEGCGPSRKKQKKDERGVFKCYLRQRNQPNFKQQILFVLNTLNGQNYCLLRGLRIAGANIAYPVRFSSATVLLEKDDNPPYSLRSIFRTAYVILEDYFNSDTENPKLPEDVKCRNALQLLLEFLMNIDKASSSLYEKSEQGEEESSEWNWTLRLAQHLFSPLSLDPRYKYDIDKHHQAERGCPCFKRDAIIHGKKEDTSFGWEDGWHGKVDILMANVPVHHDVHTPTEEYDTASELFKKDTESNVSVEVTQNDNFSTDEYGQIVAETVAFSFLRNKDTNKAISLIPCIAVTKEAVQVHFYDSVRDIFLQSSFEKLRADENRIRTPAVVLIWLALNYELFCTGIDIVGTKSGLHQLINLEKFKKEIKAPCHMKKDTSQSWIKDTAWSLNEQYIDDV